MLHGYLSRVYADLLSLSVSGEMSREITFWCSPSSGITLLYLLFEPTAFKRTRRGSGPWLSRTNPWGRSDYSADYDRDRGANTQAAPGWSSRQLWQKRRARTLLYEILITCEGESKISLSIFYYSARTRLYLRDNQRQIGCSSRPVWKWSAKVSHFFIYYCLKKSLSL